MMQYSDDKKLEIAKMIEVKYMKVKEDISLSDYMKDMIFSSLMSELEKMGIPLFMKKFEVWIQVSSVNKYIGDLYQRISNSRIF